jgi:hypothetical protein
MLNKKKWREWLFNGNVCFYLTSFLLHLIILFLMADVLLGLEK